MKEILITSLRQTNNAQKLLKTEEFQESNLQDQLKEVN